MPQAMNNPFLANMVNSLKSNPNFAHNPLAQNLLAAIYIYEGLSGSLLRQVVTHEMGHAVMASYGLIEELRRFVKPEYQIEAEEWVCNLIADYGILILSRSAEVIGSTFDILARRFEQGFG